MASPGSRGSTKSNRPWVQLQRWYKGRSATERGAILNGCIVGVIGGVFLFLVSLAQGNIVIFRDVLHIGGDNKQPPTLVARASVDASPTQAPSLIARASGDASPTTNTAAGLQLVDLTFIETETYPQLDIKLRNTGNEVVFLKQANLDIEQAWQLSWPTCQGGAGELPSWNYDVLLEPSKVPYMLSAPISQSVKPNDVDRFTITLGQDPPPDPLRTDVYLVHLSLVYNESDSSILSEPLLFAIGWAPQKDFHFPCSYNMQSCVDTCKNMIAYDQEALREIMTHPGVMNERLASIIRDIL